MKKAVVLLSGGLDSTTALFWAKRRGYSTVCLSVDYGQRHAREIRAARAVAKKAAAALHVVRIRLPWMSSSSLVNRSLGLPDIPLSRIGRGAVPSTYVPGRNALFLALGASFADAVGAGAVILGSNTQDYSGYPDCRPEFIKAFGRAVALGTRGARGGAIKMLTPLAGLDKKGIVLLARKVGAPLELTWSCYAGAGKPCGRCDSCKLRAKGFSSAQIEDPAL